ncbi:MAG: beta-ketoacyl-[acyl-carrier-protein] synthase family protein [Pseudobdellovibrionaceae bacterium]
MKHDVVITSYGIISPIGLNAADFEKNLFAGKSGVKSIRGELVPDHFPVPYAAWIPRQVLPPSKLFASEKSDQILKSWLMTEQATMQALQNLKPSDHIDAIVFGTADGVSYEIVEEILKSSLPENYNYKNVCSESSLDIVRDTAVQLGFNKVPDKNLISLNSACATGNQTLGIAFHGLRSGRWNRCLVGGVDARCEASNFLNFFLLGALTTDDVAPEKASRPFAKDRSGFVRGEGSAVLVLETREAAVARGAKILGVVSGYGCTSDAYRLTDGREDGASVIEAMKAALTDAHLQTKDIDYINAHGTSTPLNDRLETFSIKQVFTDRAYQIPISSIKSQIGHSTIASSSIEAIACLMMLDRQMVSPTINYNIPDPECDLDYVPNTSREVKLRHVLSNSFGFGGQNTCMVFSKDQK